MPKGIGYPPGSKMTATQTMRKMAGKEPMAEGTEFGSTVLSTEKYPELEGMAEGSPISGTWEGTVSKVDGKNVTVNYTSMELTTENQADKELNRMTGRVPMSAGGGMMEDEYE